MKKISKFILIIFVISVFSTIPVVSHAKKKQQILDLDGIGVDGEARTSAGDYVLQKSGVDFLPLYEKKKEMNKEIKKTVHFLR